jgi:hypothetical protein
VCGSEGTGSYVAAAPTQSRIESGSESDVGTDSETDGHFGRQMREVSGWEGAAMCT